MADIGREELIQAAIHGEKARKAEARDFYKDMRQQANADPDAELAMMGGREPNPTQIRVNIEESIGFRQEDGSMNHVTDTDAQDRYDRATAAVDRIDTYVSVESFERLPTLQQDRLVNYIADSFLLQHPLTRGYLRGFGAPNIQLGKAREIARMYLTDPKTRESIQEAIRGARFSGEAVEDTLSEAVRKLEALQASEATFRARRDALSMPGGEIETIQARKKDFEPGGTGLVQIATAKVELVVLSDRVRVTTAARDARNTELVNARNELAMHQGIKSIPTIPKGFTPRPETDLTSTIIPGLEVALGTAESNLAGRLLDHTTKQDELNAYLDEQKNIDASIDTKVRELASMNESLAEIAKQKAEVARLKAKKGQEEEVMVAELEAVFAKGIEKQVVARYGDLQERASEQAEEQKAQAATNQDKIFEDQFINRYLRVSGSGKNNITVNGRTVNVDYKTLMASSSIETIDGATFFLTGPERVTLNIMRAAGFHDDVVKAKLKDANWLAQQSDRVAQEVLKQKFMASRRLKGIVSLEQVPRFNPGELQKLSQMPWAQDWIKAAIAADEAKKEMFEEAFGAGALDDKSRFKGLLAKGTLLMLLIALGIVGGAVAPIMLSGALAMGKGAASVVGGKAMAGAAVGGTAAGGVGAFAMRPRPAAS